MQVQDVFEPNSVVDALNYYNFPSEWQPGHLLVPKSGAYKVQRAERRYTYAIRCASTWLRKKASTIERSFSVSQFVPESFLGLMNKWWYLSSWEHYLIRLHPKEASCWELRYPISWVNRLDFERYQIELQIIRRSLATTPLKRLRVHSIYQNLTISISLPSEQQFPWFANVFSMFKKAMDILRKCVDLMTCTSNKKEKSKQ